METITVQKKELSGESSMPSVIQEKQLVKVTQDIDVFIQKRQAFIEKVNRIMVETKDYHLIQGKKSLAKGGAEKIASIFLWQAKFAKDTETLEMLGTTPGLVAFKCILENKGKFVGEGRGAALLNKNAGDPNKTIKMAQKSAYVDAVIRSSGMSDFFTQDLEDHPEHLEKNTSNPYGAYSPKTSSYPPSAKQLEFVQNLLDQKRLDEEWMIDQGYGKISDLTGGKEGTCSELIEFLKTYIPKTSITTDDNNMTEDGRVMVKKLAGATSPEEFKAIQAELTSMRKQRKFTKDDLEALKEAYMKAETEIMV